MMIIDGRPVLASDGSVHKILNPATGELVGEVPSGGRQEAHQALTAASRAFPAWAATSPGKRADVLHQAASLVRELADEMAVMLTLEIGKPLRASRREVLGSADVLDYFAEEGKRAFGEWTISGAGKSRSLVIRQPIGVAALISPWNYPVDLLSWKVGAALAAGCTAVAKPSSMAPIAASAFIEAINRSGAPPGVINLVLGPGSTAGAELVESPLSQKISFTGESATGRWIMAAAAPRLKRLSLELGGSAPFIVCADADVKSAAEACVQRAFNNAGQICISVNRVYLHHDVEEEFMELAIQRAGRLRVGSGMEDVDLGPLASEEQRKRTREHIEDALSRGARLRLGGSEPEGEQYSRGHFFLPTILDRVDHSMRVMREETFGPVMPVMTFKNLEEAVRLANQTEYGLAAYAYTNSLDAAVYLAERLESGGVGINSNNVVDLQAPFGGWKQSGFGRELSHHGLEGYLELKHVKIGL